MDLLFAVLKQLNVVIACAIILYAWGAFNSFKTRMLFAAMLMAFMVSTVLFFPEGEGNEWAKHVPFLAGQVLFLCFMLSLRPSSGVASNRKMLAQRGFAPLIFTMASMLHDSQDMGASTTKYVESHGYQHVVPVPLFVIVCMTGVVRVLVSRSRQLRFSGGYMIAGLFFLTCIHINEYAVETKGYFPSLNGDPTELLEFVWFYIGCVCFVLGVRAYKRIS